MTRRSSNKLIGAAMAMGAALVIMLLLLLLKTDRQVGALHRAPVPDMEPHVLQQQYCMWLKSIEKV